MKIAQHHFFNGKWSDQYHNHVDNAACQLALAFGAREQMVNPDVFNGIRERYPSAHIIFSSTSGEILGDSVYDNSVVLTAIQFEKTQVKCVSTNIREHGGSYETGLYLMQQLPYEGLKAVFIISDGTFVNGSELVAGLNAQHPDILVTGGLAGDAARFECTLSGLDEIPAQGNIIAAGLYGDSLLVGHGSFGGWDEFGPERTITRSEKNVLYEIDNKSALDLYKQYLGDYVKELPGSALLFPLSLREKGSDKNLVRTILAINEEDKSMTFAGNLPEGNTVRLMKANFDKLIEGSSDAASYSFGGIKDREPQLAILISCVGRKLVLQDRTDEELQAAQEVLGKNVAMTGFYSYGEISPFNPGTKCELHNQTMTITTFAEI